MTSRRKFLESLSILGLGSQIKPGFSETRVQFDANNWKDIKKQFAIIQNPILNLNSGSGGSMPYPVLDEYVHYTKMFNNDAVYKVKESLSQEIENIKIRLANQLHCFSDELAFTKNTTESLNTIIWGIPLKANDEVVVANIDYPYVINALNQRAQKDQIIINQIDLNLPELSDEEIIEKYRQAFTYKTKLVVLTMITHREGQILPVKKITALAHSMNIEVLVDAAHVLGQLAHTIKDLDCDYYATCMHKWMNGPLGTGVLFVKKNIIEKLRPPAFPYPESLQSQMDKLDYSGTIAFQKILTLKSVLDFNDRITIEKKEKRLKYLTRYWTNAVKKMNGARIYSDISRSCGIATLTINGLATKVHQTLIHDHYKINIKKTGYHAKPLFRVSTNIFHDENDLDQFIHAIKEITNT